MGHRYAAALRCLGERSSNGTPRLNYRGLQPRPVSRRSRPNAGAASRAVLRPCSVAKGALSARLLLFALSESPYVGCEARGRRRRLPSTRQLSAAASRAFLILSRSLACGRPEVSEKSILLQSRCARTEFSTALWPPSRFGVGKCSWVGFQSLYLVSDSKCEAPPSSSGQRHLGIRHFTSVM